MSKVNVVNDQPENCIVMPEELIILYGGGQLFKILIRSRPSRYPHAQHGLARKPSNSEKCSIRQDFLLLVDENSYPNSRNASSAGTQYYFSPKFTQIGEPTKSKTAIVTDIKNTRTKNYLAEIET